MTRAEAYLASALKIIDLYQGELPFALWLKDYFKANKKFGSTDRKRIAELCFLFYRSSGFLVHFPHWSKAQCIRVAIGLIHADPNYWACSLLDASDLALLPLPLDEKVEAVISFDRACLSTLFPYQIFKSQIAEVFNREDYYLSMLHQPDMFVRVRPGRKPSVLASLQSAGLSYQVESDTCLRLSNGSKLDNVLVMDRDVVVQDWASQEAGKHIYTAALHAAVRKCFSTEWRDKTIDPINIPIKVWDCCAASGGKSIQLLDSDLQIKLTVSDIRSSILNNLKTRFKNAGIEHYQSMVLDLEQPIPRSHPLYNQQFDLIIADVPCSGSGTWSRTPEQLRLYDSKATKNYQDKQRKIVTQAVQQLGQNAMLVYITCSVFKEENEDQVAFIQQKLGLRLLSMEYHQGYPHKADNLFSAIFTNTQAATRNLEQEKKLAKMDTRYLHAYQHGLLSNDANRADHDAIGKP